MDTGNTVKYSFRIFEQNDWEIFKSNCTKYENSVLLKYSPSCPVSYYAQQNVEKWFEGLPAEANIQLARIDVIKDRPVSRNIAEELNIQHESPQVIWFEKNVVLFNASHNSINERLLNKYSELKITH